MSYVFNEFSSMAGRLFFWGVDFYFFRGKGKVSFFWDGGATKFLGAGKHFMLGIGEILF